jgi:hypothetical protein
MMLSRGSLALSAFGALDCALRTTATTTVVIISGGGGGGGSGQ